MKLMEASIYSTYTALAVRSGSRCFRENFLSIDVFIFLEKVGREVRMSSWKFIVFCSQVDSVIVSLEFVDTAQVTGFEMRKGIREFSINFCWSPLDVDIKRCFVKSLGGL